MEINYKSKHLRIMTLKKQNGHFVTCVIMPTINHSFEVRGFDYSRAFKSKLAAIKASVKRSIDIITNRTIYLEIDSTDCDHSRSTYAVRKSNIKKAEAFIDDLYQWAEGLTYVCEISKEEFEAFEAQHRDMALEAFENGHAHSIHR